MKKKKAKGGVKKNVKAKAKKSPAKKTKPKNNPVRLKKAARKIKKQRAAKKRKFEFVKMVASGNDFIVFDNRRANLNNGRDLALRLCKRTEGVGADGLIFIEKAKKADFKMRIFNPDGSEAEMCGNGIRCAALYKGKKNASILTLAGMLKAELKEEAVKVKMTMPLNLQLNVNLNIDGRIYQVNFVNTGVPHAVYFVQDIEVARVRLLGRLIRYHHEFDPEGTNVDFVQIVEPGTLRIRTYERGVEDETLACGTGSVASALIYHHKFVETNGSHVVTIIPQSNEILKIYFDYNQGEFSNVWMEGKARTVYKGECYV